MDIFDFKNGPDGQKTAIIQGSEKITYGGLKDLTAQYMQIFRQGGLASGDTVLLLLPLSPRFYAALIATISLKARAFILDSLGGGRVSQVISKVRPRHLLIDVLGKPRLITLYARAKDGSMKNYGAQTKEGALLTFTSGTTRLKIIERTESFLKAQAHTLDQSLALSDSKIILTTLPVFVLANLYYGVTTILTDKKSVDLTGILREKPDKIIAAPHYLTLLTSLISAQKVTLPFVQEVLLGGAPVFPRLAQALLATFPGARVTAVYGSSEAEPIAHLEITAESLKLSRQRAASGAGLCQGQVLCRTRVVDRDKLRALAGRDDLKQSDLDQITCAEGQKGEILVAGPHVVQSYLDGEGDLGTKFCFDGEVYHATGDAGYFDQDNLYLCGRAVYKSSLASECYPLEIEALALTDEAVQMSAYLEEKGQSYLFVSAVNKDKDAALELSQPLLDYVASKNIKLRLRQNLPLDKRHNSKVLYEKLRLSI